MGLLIGLIFFIGLPAGIAWAACAGLRVLAPATSRRLRIAVAAGLAGFIPILLPLATILVTAELADGMIVSAAAILVGGVIMGLVFGLPVALLATRNDQSTAPRSGIFD